MTPRYAVLMGQIEQFLGDLQQVVDRSQQILPLFSRIRKWTYRRLPEWPNSSV